MDFNSYTAGYDAAYEELDTAMRSVKHRDECGECRACLFLKDIMEHVVGHVSDHMTPEERTTVFSIFVDCYERLNNEMRWWNKNG